MKTNFELWYDEHHGGETTKDVARDAYRAGYADHAAQGNAPSHVEQAIRNGALALKRGERIELLESQISALRAFARDALENFWEGDGSMQDMGERHGLLIPTQVAESCGEGCSCDESGVGFPTECYKFAPILHIPSAASIGEGGLGDAGRDAT